MIGTEPSEEPSPGGIFVRFVERLSGLAAAIAAVCVLVIVAIVAVEVVLRNFFRSSLMVSDEFSGYFFVAVCFLGFAQTLRDGGLIRVEVVYQKLSGAALFATRWAFVLTSICYVAILLIYSVLDVASLRENGERSSSLSEIPLYLPHSLTMIGWLLLLLQLLTYVVRKMRHVP